jgi:methylisocitrate lyase
MPKSSTSAELRELIREGCVAMPGVYNAATARMVEKAGFSAVYISGAGLCNATAGVPDVGLLTLTEVAQLAGYVARAVKIPCIVDADTGFGGPDNAARTVQEFERAGLAGCHIEDQEFPKRCGHLAGKTLVTIEEMNEKVARQQLRAATRTSCSSHGPMRARWRASIKLRSVRRATSPRARMRSSRKRCKGAKSSAISPRRSTRRCWRT